MKIWIAALAAVVVQPIVFAARIAPDLIGSSQPTYGLGFMLLAVVVVGAGMMLLFGVPAFIALRRFGRDSWASIGTTGFLVGALPVSFSWPKKIEGYSSSQNWHGMHVDIYVNGVPTDFAWLTFAESVTFFGLHGLFGALTFYAVWRRLNRPNTSLHTDALS